MKNHSLWQGTKVVGPNKCVFVIIAAKLEIIKKGRNEGDKNYFRHFSRKFSYTRCFGLNPKRSRTSSSLASAIVLAVFAP